MLNLPRDDKYIGKIDWYFVSVVGKKTVVFDLDETLIHCNDSADEESDVVLAIKFPSGEIIDAGINIRPYAKKLL